MQGVDIHALDLSSLWADSLHAGDPDCVVARDRQQEPTVRSLKRGDRAQVALVRRINVRTVWFYVALGGGRNVFIAE